MELVSLLCLVYALILPLPANWISTEWLNKSDSNKVSDIERMVISAGM